MRLMGLLQGLSVCLLLSIAGSSLAQTATSPGGLIPVVTIRATDPIATWSGNPGIFTVFRQGNPAPVLNVYYQIGGSAVNGIDYQTIGNLVQIPSGVLSADIVIHPLNKGQSMTKTVTLQLGGSPLMQPLMPINHLIGYPSNATVFIVSGPVTNIPPAVSIINPTDGAVFYTPVNIPIVACASDPDGFVRSVEFFDGTTSLGIVTNPITVLPAIIGPVPPLPPMPPYRPFVLLWSNAPAAAHALTAKATDNSGAPTTSAAVDITVNVGPPPPPPPPPPNLPPVVRITSPQNNSSFRQPVNLPIYAYAADKDGYVTGVEFFAGTNDLGAGHRIDPPAGTGVASVPPILLTNLWLFVWSNAPQGTFALTAVATDNGGASTTSDAVNVEILSPPPPPLPVLPVVTIAAIDPIAIEGTNCWPWLGLASATPTWANWTATTAVYRYFTNCGPKDAIFAVHRFGSTNAALSVAYDVGGTAVRGTDYVPLPGVANIPAGHHTAFIPLVPIDDGPPDITSTVILKLTPSADYTIGRPASAAAIILDGPVPRPVTGVLADKSFHVNATGPDGAWFHVEYTTDLQHWTAICTNQVVQGAIDFVDPDAQNDSARFYRAVPEAAAP